MKITVLIPSYKRPKELERCLNALKKQSRKADEIIVVVRDNDKETHEFMKNHDSPNLTVQTIKVHAPGQVAALNAGLDAVAGDVIAITDDDATPRPDWLKRIEEHFLADPTVGGVGGRDWVHYNGQVDDRSRKVVGKIQWFGRVIGNHHLGAGKPREVDVLKGANMSFRREAIRGIRFDERLRGRGAQTQNDMAFSLGVKRAGWKLIYNPKVSVDHYPAKRHDEDQRNLFNAVALEDMTHNETLVLLDNLSSIQRLVFVVWSVFVGTRAIPGLAQVIRFLPTEGLLALRKFNAACRGRWEGWKTWRNSRGVKVEEEIEKDCWSTKFRNMEFQDINEKDRFVIKQVELLNTSRGRVLELGGGVSGWPLMLASQGNFVVVTDISKEALIKLKDVIESKNLANICLVNCSTYNLPFKEEVFRAVHGSYILHHLRHLEKAVYELYNVLGKGGKGVFLENSSQNKILMLFRYFCGHFGIPKWSDPIERPLSQKDIIKCAGVFEGRVQLHYPQFIFFHLFNAKIFKYRNRFVNCFCSTLDEFIYLNFIPLRKYSYHLILQFTKP